MKTNILTTITGAAGIGAVQAVTAIDLTEVLQVAVQVIIGVATLIGIFRRKKK